MKKFEALITAWPRNPDMSSVTITYRGVRVIRRSIPTAYTKEMHDLLAVAYEFGLEDRELNR